MATSLKNTVKSLLPRGLFMRSLMIMITPVVLLILIASFVFVDNHWNRMSNRLAESVVSEIIWLADMVESSRWNYTDIKGYASVHLELDLDYKKNVELGPMPKDRGSWERIIRASLERSLDKKTRRDYRIHIVSYKEEILINVQLSDGVVTFTVPARRVFSSSAYIFLMWMVLSSILLISIATIFMRNQIRPIRALAKATENFGKGRDTSGFKAYGAREVRQAARSFLDMRDRIDRQISQRTAMLAGVSHDLRTPLTRLKLSVSMLDECQDKTDMHEDICDMERMINGYLEFARGAGEEEKAVESDLSKLMKDIEADYKRSKNNLQLDIKDNIACTIRPIALERALTNIIDNALKYGDAAWLTADISDYNEQPVVKITIEDNGPGIDEDKLQHVFKPFYRTDEARSTKTGGVGLGLSIAQDIIHTHGGSITLDKSPHGGLKAFIYLPI